MSSCYTADRVALSKHWGNELSRQVRHAWRAPDMQPLFQANSSQNPSGLLLSLAGLAGLGTR